MTPAQRLQRLTDYVAEDPANAHLLAEAFDTAIACGRHEVADGFLAAARGLAVQGGEWTFRQARLCIARRELGQAGALLEQLRGELGEHPVLAHDAAYVKFLQGDAENARAMLQPWMDRLPMLPDLPREQRQALQVLWLRVSHREGPLEAAWAWVQQEQAAARLQPAASGVASLIAFDLDDHGAARVLADAALSIDPQQIEALVARGSVALAEGDTTQATTLLERALLSNPGDGRIWSALGLASLVRQDLPRAKLQLERALEAVPHHVDSRHALGWTLLLLGERSAALAVFRGGRACEPEDAESHAALAMAFWLCGANEEAQEHLQVADSLDPECVLSRQARGLIAGTSEHVPDLDALARRVLAQWTRRP
jgi:tetratricopeptide (TPR) repeat protein